MPMNAVQVKRLRKRLRLTQEGLAEAVGVHPMSVSRWERGVVAIPEPTAKLLRLLAAKKGAKR
jgi:transcriptional regulator with XRE-family HTH domain